MPASTGPPEDELDEVDDPDAPDEELVEPEDDELDELLDELALASAPASTGAGQPWIFTCVQPFVASHVSVVHASPSSQLPQLWHVPAPAAAHVPGAQAVQTVSADGVHAALANVPAAHVLHAAQAPFARYLPCGQLPHWFAFGPEHVVQLASHAAHTVSEAGVHAALAYVPAAQTEHGEHVLPPSQ